MAAQSGKVEASYEKVPGWRVLLWALLFLLAWNFRNIIPILKEGAFVDPDDFLRLHQVRNWMDGQGWFDVSVPRMNLPDGGDMHWSRLVDVPLAALTWFFDLVTSTELAERLASILWPTLLFIATVFVLIAICEKLFPKVNRLLVLLFIATCVAAIVEFAPGRIDHHGIQILLYCLTLLGLVHAESRWGHLLIGASVALSIVIGLDVALLLIFILGWLGLEWAFGLDPNGRGLLRTAIGLGGASILLYPLSVSPDHWLLVVCDTNSIVFLAALLGISLAFVCMAFATSATSRSSVAMTAMIRIALGGLLAGLLAGLLYVLFPQCAAGPLAGLSPELKAVWLDNVMEAKGLISFVKTEQANWIGMPIYLLMVFGLGSWLLMRDMAHPRLIAIMAIILICLILGFVQVRTYRIGIFAIVPICVIIAQASWQYFEARYASSRVMAMAATALVGAFLISPTWLAIGDLISAPFAKQLPTPQVVANPNDAPKKVVSPETSCLTKTEYAKLANLPTGNVMNALDQGPAILVFTSHNIVGGNYHRNGETILDTKDFFGSNEDDALRIAEKRAIDYVAFCWFPLPEKLNGDLSQKLGIRLMTNNPPEWLERVSGESDNLIIYRATRQF